MRIKHLLGLLGLSTLMAFSQPANAASSSYVITNHTRTIVVPTVIEEFKHLPEATRQQLLCQSVAIFYEASHRSEPDERMVAHVVVNRLHEGSFGTTPCGVVFARHAGFGFTLEHRKSHIPDGPAWERNQHIAYAAYTNPHDPDPSGGRMYFRQGKRLPPWAKHNHHQYHPIRVGPHLVY